MKILRRTLGILVMLAGILGLALSLAGLVAVWALKPTVTSFVESTIDTLNNSVATSQEAMKITNQALDATIDSVDALSTMLEATADSLEETKPVLDTVNSLMAEKLPSAMQSATSSLEAAQRGAMVLDSAIESMESFQKVLSGVPIISSFVEAPTESYDPEVPLAESLGELAGTLDSLPDMFVDMSANLAKADDNLETVQSGLTTMSDNVALISASLSGYQDMVTQSQASMENLSGMLTRIEENLGRILNGSAVILSLFFLWLLAAQVVILSQGLELYHGTATHLEGKAAGMFADQAEPLAPENPSSSDPAPQPAVAVAEPPQESAGEK